MRIGNRTFDTANHTYVMGILNVTPDSFSDGGSYNQLDLALKHVEEMMAGGRYHRCGWRIHKTGLYKDF